MDNNQSSQNHFYLKTGKQTAMISLENLDEQIRDVILVNGGDINIADYPYIIKEAEEQGISPAELARRIRKVFEAIDWRPYNQVEKQLEAIILKGSISEKEADIIVKAAESSLQRPKVINYILANLKKRGFLPREKNSFEYDSFRNNWMTEEAWAKYQREKIAVEWLGEEAHSITELADISFRKPEDAKYFLRNTNYLVPNITILTKSATKADEFSKIIENESNPDKRYLKVLYHLNPKLPFHLQKQDFDTIYALFDKTATDFALFTSAASSYNNGHIHIWLNEADPINADKLTIGSDYNSFLRFLYKVDKKHPFYFFSERFDSPGQLIKKVNVNAGYWDKTAEVIADNQLPVWFTGIGKDEWVTRYNKETEKFLNADYYSAEDVSLAKVGTLIQIIDSAVYAPKIICEPGKIELLSIESSYMAKQAISLQLQNTGFVKAKIALDINVDGIGLSNGTITFFSQNNMVRQNLILYIDPLKLIKDKAYHLNIIVETVYETLKIPAEIKVVFPKKAYYAQLAKYAVIGAIFFGFTRFVIGEMTATKSWITNQPDLYNTNAAGNNFAYFIALALFIGGLIGSIFLIKKIEKI